MRVITRKRLHVFAKQHKNSENALSDWFHIMDKTEFKSFNELRKTFPSVDRVKNLIIFNIGGNKVRLITAIHFNKGMVYIRNVLTHAAYDKETWKKDLK
ncbi:MAG: type II toxin-antitoxin system HigB family toxin [Candidatus Marinimicrobia bacterium]|nr:type II toxin-antitoxin system HigB family toxin [Candidatus Neomarinimicrobiota bacterium]